MRLLGDSPVSSFTLVNSPDREMAVLGEEGHGQGRVAEILVDEAVQPGQEVFLAGGGFAGLSLIRSGKFPRSCRRERLLP
jgi:hypothetical protein